jgi:hypothetical protein
VAGALLLADLTPNNQSREAHRNDNEAANA